MPISWENVKQAGRILVDIYQWFRGSGRDDGNESILILGAGGVGKSTLAKMLAGEYDQLLSIPGEYAESVVVERYNLPGIGMVEVVVPPGQPHRRDATWDDWLKFIGAGRCRGVILMSAFGYHSLGESIGYRDHRLYKGNKEEFLQALLNENRDEELKVLQELAPYLKIAPNRVWILSVVAKQDLWNSKQADVEEHYRRGAYSSEIQAIVDVEPSRIRHEFAFVSLVIANFETGKAERLKANAEGFDHLCQVKTVRRLLETVNALREWEQSK